MGIFKADTGSPTHSIISDVYNGLELNAGLFNPDTEIRRIIVRSRLVGAGGAVRVF